MDKQKRILEMAKDICRVKHICNDVCKPISACDALKYAERAVEAGYRKQSEWISVDERLPTRPGAYLVFTCDRRISMCHFIDHYCDGDMQFDDYRVTHWMPLPEAPKMKGGVTAESAIKAVQEAAHKLKGTPPDDLLGIGSTMQF